MAKFIDFELVKASYSILDVAEILELDLKEEGAQYRSSCPVCGGKRSLVITPGKHLFYCHEAKRGGDLIALYAHVQELGMRDAAEQLHNSLTLPEKGAPSVDGLQPLSHLEHDHNDVTALGFDPLEAKALGIGRAKKGLMRGLVAVPLRTPDGLLVGYIGIRDARLPPSLKLPNSNVVAFPNKETA